MTAFLILGILVGVYTGDYNFIWVMAILVIIGIIATNVQLRRQHQAFKSVQSQTS